MMRTFTIQDIRALKPCTDPTKWVPEGWTGTIADILNMSNVVHMDKLWVVLRLLPVMSRMAFALYTGRIALKCVKNPDPRSVAACDAIEGYIQGTVSQEQLLAARSAAYAVAVAVYATAAAYAIAAAYADAAYTDADAAADAADAAAAAAVAAAYADAAAARKMTRIKAEELQCDCLRALAEQVGDK